VDISDADLVRLARDGDLVAFRLLVERYQPMVRARAAALCANRSDVDDVVQESFLQAFVGLDRLREPDRFAGWLVGIVFNVGRRLYRRAPVTLLPDWPEPLHPVSGEGLPSAEDLDRADALRAAVADLPAGQRRAVELHYYADLPAGQIAESPGAARASLHKARLRLRAYLTAHRPDLVPAVSRRTPMTAVRIARVETPFPPGPKPLRSPTHLVTLVDEAGRRELPIWLLGFDGVRVFRLLSPSPSSAGSESAGSESAGSGLAGTADELAGELLDAAGARVTGVDIDELGPEVTAARIGIAGPSGTGHVTARLAEGLALAITTGAPVRVADAVMDRLAVPTVGEAAGESGAPVHRMHWVRRVLRVRRGVVRLGRCRAPGPRRSRPSWPRGVGRGRGTSHGTWRSVTGWTAGCSAAASPSTPARRTGTTTRVPPRTAWRWYPRRSRAPKASPSSARRSSPTTTAAPRSPSAASSGPAPARAAPAWRFASTEAATSADR
jgi:RNA polymerase sigma-70 factor (ECF subfamily)